MTVAHMESKLQVPNWIREELKECMQCGTCSSVCPVAEDSDTAGPRKIMAYLLAGDLESALKSKFIWLCASCQTCTVECPKHIHVNLIIGGVKELAIKLGYAPKKDNMVRMIEAFNEVVDNGGRISEFKLMRKVIGFRIGLAFENLPLALKLHSKGRLKLGASTIKDPNEMRRIFARLEE